MTFQILDNKIYCKWTFILYSSRHLKFYIVFTKIIASDLKSRPVAYDVMPNLATGPFAVFHRIPLVTGMAL